MRRRNCPYCFETLKNTVHIPLLKWRRTNTLQCPNCLSWSRIIPKTSLSYFAVSVLTSALFIIIFLCPFILLGFAVIFMDQIIPELMLNAAILILLFIAFFLADYARSFLMNMWNWKTGDLILERPAKDTQAFD